MLKKCKNPKCNNEFEVPKFGARLYCSNKCRDSNYYQMNSERYKQNAKDWVKKNPDKAKEMHKKAMKKFIKKKPNRFNELMKENYQRNKIKHHARTLAWNIVNGKNHSKKYELKDKCCKICGREDNLIIHLEEFPTSTQTMKLAMDNGKIYYLCKECKYKIR